MPKEIQIKEDLKDVRESKRSCLGGSVNSLWYMEKQKMDGGSRMESLVRMTRHRDFELNPTSSTRNDPLMFPCKRTKIRSFILFAFTKHFKLLRQ